MNIHHSQYILYKNKRKYSDIRFSSLDEIQNYIQFQTPLNVNSTNFYDVYDYEMGFWQKRWIVIVEACDKTISFYDNVPNKTPRTKNFHK